MCVCVCDCACAGARWSAAPCVVRARRRTRAFAPRPPAQALYSGKVDKERAARGMSDPEVQRILKDPVVQQLLRDFKENPKAAQAAMRDPDMAAKMQVRARVVCLCVGQCDVVDHVCVCVCVGGGGDAVGHMSCAPRAGAHRVGGALRGRRRRRPQVAALCARVRMHACVRVWVWVCL